MPQQGSAAHPSTVGYIYVNPDEDLTQVVTDEHVTVLEVGYAMAYRAEVGSAWVFEGSSELWEKGWALDVPGKWEAVPDEDGLFGRRVHRISSAAPNA